MEISFDTLDTPALTKAQLAEMLFEQIGLNKREAKDFVDAFFEAINVELANGCDIKISGFGNFEVKSKSARPGRNPRTGAGRDQPRSEPTRRPPRETRRSGTN